MKYQKSGTTLIFYFEGEFDNYQVASIKEECSALIALHQPKTLKLDFRDVTFVDSTGIGFVLGRYKQMQKHQGEVILCNVSKTNQTLFHMSGLFRIIRLEQSEVAR